jgi:hypothetical protein
MTDALTAKAVYSDVIPRAAEYGGLVLVLSIVAVTGFVGVIWLMRYNLKEMRTVIQNNTDAWKEVKNAIENIRKSS